MLQQFIVLKTSQFSKMSNGRSASRLFLGEENFNFYDNFEDEEANKEIPLYKKGIRKTYVYFLESEKVSQALKKGDKILIYVSNVQEKIFTPEEGEPQIQRTLQGQLLVSDSFLDRLITSSSSSSSTSTPAKKKKPLKKAVKKAVKKEETDVEVETEAETEAETKTETKTEKAPF